MACIAPTLLSKLVHKPTYRPVLVCFEREQEPQDLSEDLTEKTRCGMDEEDPSSAVSVEDVERIADELFRDFDGTCLLIANEVASSSDPVLLFEIVKRIGALQQKEDDEDEEHGRSWLPDELFERFETDFLPQVAQLVLRRHFDRECVEHANSFLQFVLVKVKAKLLAGDPCLLLSLMQILDEQKQFYAYHGISSADEGDQEENDNGADEERKLGHTQQFAVVERNPYVSVYFLQNLQFWGDIGGFSLFLASLRSILSDSDGDTGGEDDTILSFEAIQCIFRTLYAVKDHLARHFLLQYFHPFCDSVRFFMEKVSSAEFHALPRESLLEVVQVMELVLVKVLQIHEQKLLVYGDEDEEEQDDVTADLLKQSVQLLRLEILLRQFRSSSLEKRIYGLSEIVMLTTRQYNEQVQEQPNPTAASLMDKLQYLVTWLHEKEIMEELFGEKLHAELIKRSVPLFQFVSELECLDSRWLDLVWHCYGDSDAHQLKQRHEAHRTIVQDLLMELVEFVDEPLLRHLFLKLQGTSAVDAGQLALLGGIAARSSTVDDSQEFSATTRGESKRLREQVLMHLWNTVLPSVASESIMEQVLEQMEEIVRRDAKERSYSIGDENEEPVGLSSSTHPRVASELVNNLLRACVDNVRQHRQIIVSLKLFTRLALMVTELKWQPPALTSFGQDLAAEILLYELVDYKSSCCGNPAGQETTLHHSAARLTGVKVRLLALRAAWMMETQLNSRSHLGSPLARSQLDLVWRLLIEEGVTIDEASLCFQWIEFCMNTSVSLTSNDDESESCESPLLPPELVEYLLMHKFSSVPGDRVTLSTLCCFHGLFRRLNLQNGGLQSFAAPSSDDDECGPTSSEGVVDLATREPLVGVEQLWHLAIQSTNSEVAEECITLLASFYLEFVPELRGSDVSLQKKLEFVETCMGFLAAAKSKVDHASEGITQNDDREMAASIATVNRCIDLLRYFMDACDAALDDLVTNSCQGSSDALDSFSSADMLSIRGYSMSEELKLKRSIFQLENLEDRLQHLEIYPSPMKEMQLVSAAQAEALLNPSRRPSWTFRQYHALLDAIPDEDESEVGEGSVVSSRWTGRRDNSEASLRVSTSAVEANMKFSSEELPVSPRGSSLLPGKSAMKSPTVRVRPNLQWPQDVSPQRGPDLSLEDISKALQEVDCEGSGESQAQASEIGTESTSAPPLAKPKYSIMSQILANEETYFDTLLQLVDWDDATSQRTWELICRLPTNNDLLRRMIRLRPSAVGASENVIWSALLNTSNIHRLLYALRLVEALLLPVEDAGITGADQTSDSARRQWRERFVRLGGAKHLYDTLLQWESIHLAGQSDTHHGGIDSAGVGTAYTRNLVATCLAAVVRTLHYFIQVHRRKPLESRRGVQACTFDVRLNMSTLPAFMRSISVGSLGESAVRLTFAYSSRTCTSLTSHAAGNGKDGSISAQTEEAIQCGVQLFTAVASLDLDLVVDGLWSLQIKNQSTPTLIEWIKAMLLDCLSPATRVTALGSLIELTAEPHICKGKSRFIEHLVRGLSELLVSPASDNADPQQLFTFLDSLLSTSAPKLEKESRESVVLWLSENAIPQRLLSRLHGHASQNSTNEKLICGYLKLLRSLVLLSDNLRDAALNCRPESASKDLGLPPTSHWTVDFLLKNLLFGNPGAVPDADEDGNVIVPRCKTNRSRELAQTLLFTLVFQSREAFAPDSAQASLTTVNHVLQCHDSFQKSVLATLRMRGRPWNFAPSDLLQDSENEIYHAGLVNPGCICYMNALVQQLFMIPSFREGLLSVDCLTADSNPSQWSDEIAQLQKLFVSMAFTNFKSFDPTTFALSHHDLDGNPTDLRVQMDADEFFCLLLDRIDTSLCSADQQQSLHQEELRSNSSQSAVNFLENCFGGVLVNQIITQQGHISEREEKFFALSLEVSKKQHLRDSLAMYVEGESLDGENAYFCERLQQKVAATKRICIKKLPQTLVCHLKRFEFDFDTMEKLKINDYLEFPQEIDMFPFTSEALSTAHDQLESADISEQSTMYDLVGIVVHSGTSDMGHYYSFIKDRAHPQRWLEFNDEVVREFEIEMIGDECFGGEEVKQQWEGNARVSKIQMKRRNAYMLMYERRAEPVTVSSQEHEEQVQVATARSVQSVNLSLQKLINETCQENALFQSLVDAFGPRYSHFVKMLANLALSLPFDSSTRSSDVQKKLEEWDGTMAKLPSDFVNLQACVLGCQYLFGVASLQSSSIDQASLLSQNSLLKRVLEWLTTEDPATDADDVSDKCVFSAWLLRQAIASPPSSAQEIVSVARTWIFDVIFLNESNPDLVDGCIGILSSSVSILTKHLTSGEDEPSEDENNYRTVLVDFYRVLLDLFHDREPSIELADPTTGGAMTLSTTTVVSALTRIGALLESCICSKFADSLEEQATTHHILITDLQFFDRLLFTLQVEQKDPMSPENLYSHLSSLSAPLDESGISRVRSCTLDTERRMIQELLSSIFDEPRTSSDVSSLRQQQRNRGPRIPVDANLVLNQTALSNILKYNLHEELTPVLVQIAERGSSSQRDKLLSLLMTVLEDVKTTHLEQMLHVFHSLLDAEESVVQTDIGDPSIVEKVPIHQHLFSASKGILEAAGYYKDHRILYEYTFQLLDFCVNRGKNSQLLQQLFKCDEDLHDQVPWVVEWLTKYLDPTGSIWQAEHAKKADEIPGEDSENEVVKQDICTMFEAIEKAFGCSVFTDEDLSLVQSERRRPSSQDELPEYDDNGMNQSDDDGQDALSLDDVVAEFTEEAHDAKEQTAPKFSIIVKEEQGPEVEDDEDEDDQAFNNLTPFPSAGEKKYSTEPGFTPLKAPQAASRAVAMREFMYNNRGNEA